MTADFWMCSHCQLARRVFGMQHMNMRSMKAIAHCLAPRIPAHLPLKWPQGTRTAILPAAATAAASRSAGWVPADFNRSKHYRYNLPIDEVLSMA